MRNNSPTNENNPSHRSHLQGPCFAKFLLNNSAAGSLIGKNGVTIGSTEQETGTIMKLSSTTTFFPNTQDRILTISGSEQSVCKAILLIIDKISLPHNPLYYRKQGFENALHFLDNDFQSSNHGKNNKLEMSVKMVIPKTSISSLIGKGGSRIRTMQENLNCKIHVYNRCPELSERIVVSVGEIEALKKAVIALVLLFQNDVNLKEYASITYPSLLNNYKYTPYINVINRLDFGNASCKIAINISDSTFNSLIGQNGNSIDQISHSTGAHIKIYPKDLSPSRLSYRKLVLSGPVNAVHTAHALLLVKIGNITSNKDSLVFEDFIDDYEDLFFGSNSSFNSANSFGNTYNNYFTDYENNYFNNSFNNSIPIGNSNSTYDIFGSDERSSLFINDIASFALSNQSDD